ncbi:hypothetical protein D9758_017638 [Tetrapyrgos nigripes]|uniref:Uncharacterized protein n=1 Tax=Tetrapyrgos nigripes TaxID=182062 RepID=A0A8H5CGX8_9AGAR|nr:hypothetical protein D9758_017638 [Tetrapyrgos nigripes]
MAIQSTHCSSFSSSSSWQAFTHPDGWLYYYHPETNSVMYASEQPKEDPEMNKTSELENLEVLLDIRKKTEDVCQPRPSIRFVRFRQNYYLSIYPDDLRIDYWKFMCDYPSHRPLFNDNQEPPFSDFEPFQNAKMVLNFFKMDLLRRRLDSEAPFDLDQCKELLDHLNTYEPSSSRLTSPNEKVAFGVLISWILWVSAKHCQLHEYGRHSRRKSDPLRGYKQRITEAFRAMKLQDRTDGWVTLLRTIEQELTVSNLGATVLLSSSTAFLAVPGIDRNTQIITLMSMVLTLGSTITGLYLQCQTGRIGFKDVGQSILPSVFILQAHRGRYEELRPIMLAILFSVPFATFVWAMILFTVAVILFSKVGMSSSGEGASSTNPAPSLGNAAFTAVLTVTCMFFVIVLIIVVFFRLVQWQRRQNIQKEVEGARINKEVEVVVEKPSVEPRQDGLSPTSAVENIALYHMITVYNKSAK